MITPPGFASRAVRGGWSPNLESTERKNHFKVNDHLKWFLPSSLDFAPSWHEMLIPIVPPAIRIEPPMSMPRSLSNPITRKPNPITIIIAFQIFIGLRVCPNTHFASHSSQCTWQIERPSTPKKQLAVFHTLKHRQFITYCRPCHPDSPSASLRNPTTESAERATTKRRSKDSHPLSWGRGTG